MNENQDNLTSKQVKNDPAKEKVKEMIDICKTYSHNLNFYQTLTD